MSPSLLLALIMRSGLRTETVTVCPRLNPFLHRLGLSLLFCRPLPN
jgi:hypothetical protein